MQVTTLFLNCFCIWDPKGYTEFVENLFCDKLKCSQRAQVKVVYTIRYLFMLDRPIDHNDNFLQIGDL